VREPTIVAMGGGGFSADPDDTRLDDYVLSLVGRERPRVCFLPTASGDSDAYIARFHAAFPPERAQATHLPLFNRRGDDPRGHLLAQDVVYVGGGNTANMLAVWRLHRIDAALREAWQAGVVLCGLSAGALCWFEGGVTDSFGPNSSACTMGWGCSPAATAPTTTPSPGARPIAGSSPRACPPGSPPTTGSAFASWAPSWPRSSAPGPRGGPISCSGTAPTSPRIPSPRDPFPDKFAFCRHIWSFL
jgi:dipeptidase E